MTHDVKIQIRKTEEENSEFCGALSIRVPSTKGGSQVTGLYDAEADASYLGTLQESRGIAESEPQMFELSSHFTRILTKTHVLALLR